MATWKIDPDHSVASFAIRHMMITAIRGQFNGISGIIEFNPADPSGSSVAAEIDVTSLTTGNKKRDEHLFSADFFEVERYPLITFKSTKVEKTESSNRGKMSGDLTIHGITRPITMDVNYFGPVTSPKDLGGETAIGFTTSLTVNRDDFGILWNVSLGDDNLMVGKEVQIALDIEADLAE
jgi:polyisoprenoid-binding protein YceI